MELREGFLVTQNCRVQKCIHSVQERMMFGGTAILGCEGMQAACSKKHLPFARKFVFFWKLRQDKSRLSF